MTADLGTAGLTGSAVSPSANRADPVVDVLTIDLWEKLRDIRLRALRQSPHAFVADAITEAKLNEKYWKNCITSSTWVAARDGDEIVGIACSVPTQEVGRARYIESVWVDPNYRNQGILRRMLDRIEEDAWLDGVTRLMLWVLDTNQSARAAYSRLRFDVDPQQEPLNTTKMGSGNVFVKEERMYRLVASPSPAKRNLDSYGQSSTTV
jgi:GNAT superfamily N-acetyltransferase